MRSFVLERASCIPAGALCISALLLTACPAAPVIEDPDGGQDGGAPGGQSDAGQVLDRCAPAPEAQFILNSTESSPQLVSDGTRVWYAFVQGTSWQLGSLADTPAAQTDGGVPLALTNQMPVSLVRMHGVTRALWIDADQAHVATLGEDGQAIGAPTAVSVPTPVGKGPQLVERGSGAALLVISNGVLHETPLDSTMAATGPAVVLDSFVTRVYAVHGEDHGAVLWFRNEAGVGTLRVSLDGAAAVDLLATDAFTRTTGMRRAAAIPGGFAVVVEDSTSYDADQHLLWFDWSGNKLQEQLLPKVTYSGWELVSFGGQMFRATTKRSSTGKRSVWHCLGAATAMTSKCGEISGSNVNHEYSYVDAAPTRHGWSLSYTFHNGSGTPGMSFVCDPTWAAGECSCQ